MRIRAYLEILRLPGVRPLLLLALLARIPVTAAGITLTLHVVGDLDRGYGAAGLVGAASTIGSALGAPLLGRLVDRRGLRLMLAITTVAEAAFWGAAPVLPYPALLVAALLGGLLTLPVFSVVRQSLAALVPAQRRRPAYALDSMSVELSYMAGPALAVVLVTTVSARAAMVAVGLGIVLSGIALFVLDPPVHGGEEGGGAEAPAPRRDWLDRRLLALLGVCAGATLVLGGTDVAVVAALRESGHVGSTGVVLAAWGGFSLIGGFLYGTAHRPLPPVLLIGLLGLLTVPLGLVPGWPWLCVALLPAGMLCAPSLAATADGVSRLAPAGARGEAMGLHGSALTLGMAVGAPLAGAVIDATAPGWGFAAAGLGGALAALAALPLLGTWSAADGPAPAAGADPGGPHLVAAGPPGDGPVAPPGTH